MLNVGGKTQREMIQTKFTINQQGTKIYRRKGNKRRNKLIRCKRADDKVRKRKRKND